jgi:glycosyltransferase involved in cell wall biosynthesis
MKILAYMAIWKRPEITERCFKGLKKLGLEVFAVVSEDWAEDLCKKYKAGFVRTENNPLGKKLNTGLAALMGKRFDYLMTIGSDNFINPALFEAYKYYMDKGVGLIGVDKVYFMEGDKAKFVDYQLQIIGAGRMISREALETAKQVKVRFLKSVGGMIQGQPGEEKFIPVHRAISGDRNDILEIIGEEKVILWDEDKNRALDGSSNLRLIADGVSNKCIDVGKHPYILDMKGEDNIWKYDDIAGDPAEYNYVKRCFLAN